MKSFLALVLFFAFSAHAEDNLKFVCEIEYRADNMNLYSASRVMSDLNESTNPNKSENTSVGLTDENFTLTATYVSHYVFKSGGGMPAQYTGKDYIDVSLTDLKSGLISNYNQRYNRHLSEHNTASFYMELRGNIGEVSWRNLTTKEIIKFKPDLATVRCVTGYFN